MSINRDMTEEEKGLTNKKDMRWWHIEEYLTGKKSLIIGKKTRIISYHCDETKFSFRYFNNIDMFYFHIVLFHKCIEFHYYHRL